MGAGGYYDAHSEYQRRVIEAGDELIRSMMEKVELDSVETFTIADYGAGTGGTSVHAVKGAIGVLRKRNRDLPVLAVHNDVPTSDFSQLFRNVAGPNGYVGVEGGPVYAAAVAGSFFGQVLPSGSVGAGMCSNAVHWLREQPRARVPDGMYFSDATGRARHELAGQAARDWEAFLSARDRMGRNRFNRLVVNCDSVGSIRPTHPAPLVDEDSPFPFVSGRRPSACSHPCQPCWLLVLEAAARKKHL